MSLDEYRIIQVYLRDINSALKDASTEDIMELFKKLYNKEQSFAKKLQSTAYGRKVYIMFISKIAKAQGGIKSAKTFFRARQNSYFLTVNKAIKEMEPKLMYNVPINYKFCLFAIESLTLTDERGLKKDRDAKLADLFKEIKALREEIISKHLYLSLNRAKIHSKSTYGMSVDFEDLVQIANEALIVAVDKYVMGDEASSFHAMAIGRMLANLITNGTILSSVTIGQHAQKKLYQIRKLLQKNPDFKSNEIASALSIAEEEINDLMNTTSYRSLDEELGEDSETRYGDIISDEKSTSQYEDVEKKSMLDLLSKGFNVLSVMEKKVLILKGVKIDE